MSTFRTLGSKSWESALCCISWLHKLKVHFCALWVQLDPFGPIWAPRSPPPEGRPGLWTAGWGRMGRGGARVGWAASGARSGERRPPLSGSGASAPEVVPLHSYPRRGLTGTRMKVPYEDFVLHVKVSSLVGTLQLIPALGASTTLCRRPQLPSLVPVSPLRG